MIVSPKDCGGCHQKEVDQQKGSHHAKAGEILASLDNFLGSVLGGPPAVAVGCFQCHGSTVKVLPNGKFDPATWPNTGIGRINPDGSAGSCSACHTRHRFSKAQAREPQTCGKCHLGPDHPQMEVYQESKHGILWDVNKLTPQHRQEPMAGRRRIYRGAFMRDLPYGRDPDPGRDA